MSYAATRVRALGQGRIEPRGEYVLYWMQIYRRLTRNHALDHALAAAARLGKPLVVYEGLRLDYPWASPRLHRFVLEGMRDNAASASALGLNYWPWVERRRGEGRGLLDVLAARAALVVTDDFPCFIVPRQTAALAARASTAVELVDGSGIVPLSLLGPPVARAADLRRRIHRAFAEAWGHRAARQPRVGAAAARRVTPPFDPAPLGDLDRLLASLPLESRVRPVPGRPGGSAAARRRLRAFVARGLPGYAERHSHPAPPGTARSSGLSPYLHFGHISIEEVVERVLGAAAPWSPAATHIAAAGRRAGFFGRDADVDAFLDEAITWRDLGSHWHRHRGEDTVSLERALPAWALATFRAHARDRRDRIYDLETLEAAATHDPLWNAAQRELAATGTIHGYLRMLWGKKVIEWSRTPADAYAALVQLNNAYALDGRDPNSWTGILWCFGLFDRPWAPERRVLGRVRYMSSENTARKFRLGPYLDYVAALPWVDPRPASGAPRAPHRRKR